MLENSIHTRSRNAFKGSLLGVTSLTSKQKEIFLNRIRSTEARQALKQWLSGKSRRLGQGAYAYNRYLKNDLDGTYVWVFAHTDGYDRLWEVIPE